MNQLKEHIVYRIVTLFLVFTLIVPSFVKLAHAFEDHKHEVCETPQKLHFHDFEIDCEFYKFKLNPQVTYSFDFTISLNNENLTDEITSQYYFVSDFQKLPFALRGPPCLV